MTLKRVGEMHQSTITDHYQLMHYLETEGSEGTLRGAPHLRVAAGLHTAPRFLG